jgi:hypothetical protein
MTRSIIRTATIAIAIAALAAPTALARPDAPPAETKAAAAKHSQHARSPDAIDAAANPRDVRSPDAPHQGPWSSLPGTSPPAQELNPTPTKRLPGPPTWPVNPQPINPVPANHASNTGGGLDWTTIAIGVATGLLAIGAIASRTRRIGRARITA